MSLNIYIARHRQNVDNVNGILNGHRDLPLTDLGRRQALDLAKSIVEVNLSFDAIYTSPLIRAAETARIIADELRIPNTHIIPELFERNFGVMTGKRVSDIEKLCAPNIIKAEIITYFLNPRGAETFPDLVERGNRVLAIIRQLLSTGNVLLVCHGDIGKMIYAAATGKDWKEVLTDFHFGNGDLIDINPDNEACTIQLPQYNH